MLLVTEGKRKENQLGYNKKTQEYVYFHHDKEAWREKGDTTLLDYFNYLRTTGQFCDEEAMIEMPTYHIYERYIESCFEFEKKERRW